MGLVRQRIHHVVHAELVCLVRQVDRVPARIRELPVLPDVVVEVHDRHETPRRIVILEDSPELHRRAVRARHLQRLDLEERLEDRMGQLHGKRPRIGQHALELRLEVAPVVAPEVVENDEPALEHIVAEPDNLDIGRKPKARLRHVCERKLVELRVVEGGPQ